jgi:gliding motility-associated-like protein/uncharacterized repeat protein (TIGR01451 family)
MKIRIVFIIVIVSALLFFSNTSFGQAPNLGTAADFELFTSVGAVTNTGISQIAGNVGTNSGSSTGFGNVNGVMHDGDGASGQCATDLSTASLLLDGTVATNFPANLLGNGQILLAGVYNIASATTMNADLILDAQNDPNAVFIIKIQGTFGANTNSKVKLINGALACNVFWKVDNAVNLASGVSMKGSIISGGAITMNTLDTLEGRALTTAGLINVDGVLAYTPTGCGSPVHNGPTAPALGSTVCYALFSSVGPVTNFGISFITGDIGTNNGLTIGHIPFFVTGQIHYIPDGGTVQAAADLLNVYNYLNALPYDIELLYPPQFGNNLVLTPHTYIMNGATTFTDTLFLNAEGNSNAVFVIQVKGAFSTSTFSNIKLINGAKAENVFWMIDGAVDINNFSNFNGTIICNNGAINLNLGTNINGRVMTTNGSLNSFSITDMITPGCGNTYAPVITIEPTNQTACVSGPGSLSVTATGTDLTYQWRKGNVDLVNGINMSGVHSSVLRINSVTVADTSSFYNVVVSGTIAPNDTSKNVSLLFAISPTITAQPSDKTTCEGDTVIFSTAAIGSDLTYQWRKGTTYLINNSTISGVNSDTLIINGVTISDAATDYNVIVRGKCLVNDTSNNASLVVNALPNIVIQPSDKTVCSGSSVSFPTTTVGTGLSYQWKKGSTNVNNSSTISGATTATLTINPADVSDAASNYNLVITGTCAPNDTSVNVSLTVNTLPVITTAPIDKTVCNDSTVSFSVDATGTGINYQWRKGSTNLNNGLTMSGVHTATLTINPVSMSDAANNYNVVISGSCSPNVTSVDVSLVVNATPVAVASSNSSVCTGSSIDLFAQTVSSGNYFWTGPASFSSSDQNPVITSASSANVGTYSLTVSSNGCISAPTTTTVEVNNCADLSIVKTVSTTHPIIGHTVVFTIVVSNNGQSTATGLIVIDELKSGYTYLSSITTKGTFNPATGVWSISTLNDGETATLKITVTVLATGDYSNTATISGDQVDDDTINNTSLIETHPTDFNIPEGFSPDADGINDVYVIRGIDSYPDNIFTVFNRWGGKVFDAKPYINTWDGKATKGIKMGGDELPVGTYFYVLDLGDGSAIHKGTIYLNK